MLKKSEKAKSYIDLVWFMKSVANFGTLGITVPNVVRPIVANILFRQIQNRNGTKL
jgi:hypothetical protein